MADDAAIVEDDADEGLAAERAEEVVVRELQENCADVELAARGGDRGRVFEERRFEAGFGLRVMNDGPAVVFGAFDDIDFVAAGTLKERHAVNEARTVFSLKHQAGCRLKIHTLRVAMSV